jgi:hypothetical protein
MRGRCPGNDVEDHIPVSNRDHNATSGQFLYGVHDARDFGRCGYYPHPNVLATLYVGRLQPPLRLHQIFGSIDILE